MLPRLGHGQELFYGLTDLGRVAAHEALNKNGYIGPAPVPVSVYEKVVAAQSVHLVKVKQQQTQDAFKDIVIKDSLLDQLGPALNSGRSIVIYGPPGTGKTYITQSCTTNCLAPVVKVLHEQIGIKHGSMTTIHDITNTQTILDAPHKDLRRARACGQSLIPTTTGSATAITHIFPELKGKLNGHAVRVPLANASITDCVFEMQRPVTEAEVNGLLKQAAEGEFKDILGYEERPLVSVDYKTDPRSSIVDALSTMVVNDTQLKVYIWYDNEWGYANRTAELTRARSHRHQGANSYGAR